MILAARFAGSALALALTLLAATAFAQGTVRTQGRDVTPGPGAPAPPAGSSLGLRDVREDMRKFIQAISTYARQQKPGFLIVSQNGLDLLMKPEAADETRRAPARTYMQSIDGALVDGVFYGVPEAGKPVTDERRAYLLPLIDEAKRARLPVLAMDYVREAAGVSDAYRQLSGKGLIPYVAASPGPELNRISGSGLTPWGVNSQSVISMAGVRNFVYLRDSTGFGRQDEFAFKMHDTNYDLVIVDAFHGRQALSKQAVETLRYKKLGAKRLVFAYVPIGSAASYRYYWQQGWEPGSPTWIKDPFPGDPDRYYVEFWDPAWQAIIFGNAQSYIRGVIDLGFDGAVLDDLDVFRFFTGDEPGTQNLP